MFIHQKSFTTFRVTEWPSSQASHYRLFNTPKLRYDLSVLVDFLARAIFDTNKAFVRYSTFSLVNAVSPLANLSFGYAPPPSDKLKRFHPLTFTFAFTMRDQYPIEINPMFSMRPQKHAHIWGNSLLGNSDYLTINVPKRIMQEVGLNVPNLREMEWLYMAIGAWSKGFARRNKFYTHKDLFLASPLDPVTAYSILYHAKLQKLFKRTNYNEWGYSKDMWQLAPNFLSPRAANDDFLDYYCRYLAHDFYGKYRTNNIEEIERLAEEYLKPGVLDIISQLSTEDTIAVEPQFEQANSRSFRTVQVMLNGNLNLLRSQTDIQGAIRSLLSGRFRGTV